MVANDLIKISKKNLENKKEKKIMVTVMSYKNCDKKKLSSWTETQRYKDDNSYSRR